MKLYRSSLWVEGYTKVFLGGSGGKIWVVMRSGSGEIAFPGSYVATAPSPE